MPDKQTAGSVFGSAPLSPSRKTVLLLSPFTEVPQSPKAMHPGSHSAKIQKAVKLVLLTKRIPMAETKKMSLQLGAVGHTCDPNAREMEADKELKVIHSSASCQNRGQPRSHEIGKRTKKGLER